MVFEDIPFASKWHLLDITGQTVMDKKIEEKQRISAVAAPIVERQTTCTGARAMPVFF